MVSVLNFALLVLAFVSLAEAAVPYKTAYFEQKLDHFNFVQDKTFKQRYLYTDQYWNENGPIFFYTGNEGPITGFWDNSGFVFEAAEKFNALVIFGEHRYYGESMPFGSSSFDHDKVGYLTVEEALADFAVLVTELKTQFKATKSKVVAFGGSYGGMLSAYMRFKYPNVIDAALAASAPIYMITFTGSEREFFFPAVTKDFLNADPNCPGNVVSAFEMLEKLKNQGPEGLAELSKIFKLCKPLESTEQIPHLLGWIRNVFTNLAMGDYPYPTNFLAPLPGHPVNVACKMMASASSKLQGLAEVTAMVYNGTNGTLPCLDPDTEYIECADPTGCGVGPDSRAWDYQACTELALPAGSNNKTDMFPPLPWTPDMRAKYCQEKWGVAQRPGWSATQLWGKDISSASNIIFSNGDLDPWRPGGNSVRFSHVSEASKQTMATLQDDVEEVQFSEVSENNKLNDAERIKLVTLMKEKKCLWGNEKYSREEKQAALTELEEAFDLFYTSTELMSVWKSLRASMLREVKKQRKEPGSKSVWKFYQAMLFLKPTLEKACDKSEEWPEEEKRSLINFYNQNHELWNHKLRDYHDKAKRQVLLAKLREELENKYTDKEIVATWNHLKTYYDRELLREKGSKPSGTGTSQVYHSSWKFFQEMSFVADANIEPDTARSTLDLTGRSPASSSDGTEDTPATSYQQPRRKRKVSTTDEESTAKRNLMYDAAIQFMQQPPPPPPQPKGDEDLFGEYVASQLKLITDLRRKLFIKARINNLFLMQQMEQIPNAAPAAQVNNQFLSQDYGPYY